MDTARSDAIDYLNQYSEILGTVEVEEHIFDKVVHWQFDNLLRGENLQSLINDELFTGANSIPFRLQPRNPPTVAIGSVKNIVVLTANPGFGSLNQNEIKLRADKGGNRSFCSRFFSEHAKHSQQIDWWKRVVGFAYESSTGRVFPNASHNSELSSGSVAKLDELWHWADCGNIGAVDLIPFHSTKDGLTSKLIGTRSSSTHHNVLQALRECAKATIRMTLRLGPRVIVVGSLAGAKMTEEVAEKEGWHRQPDLLCPFTELGNWPHQHVYVLHHWKRSDATTLLTVSGQLFSSQGGLGHLRKGLPNVIHKRFLSMENVAS